MPINCITCEHKGRPANLVPCDVCQRVSSGQRGVVYTKHKLKGGAREQQQQ